MSSSSKPEAPLSLRSTLFWCTISLISTTTSIISLSTMQCFTSLTHPYTTPITLLASLPILTLHLYLFLNLHNIPTYDPLQAYLTHAVVDTCGTFIRFGAMFFPRENSLEVLVFYTALAVDVMALMKLVRTMEDGGVFHHFMWACVYRAAALCFTFGWAHYGLFYGFLALLTFYYNFSRVFFRDRLRRSQTQNVVVVM